ncbi:MAG: efflux RND transporter periplasmic adaptor subunit [Acidobacteriota bacterium]
MKTRMIRYGLVGIGAALVAWGGYSALQDDPSDPESSVIRPVRTVVARSVDVSEILEQTGEIQPRRETALAFQIGGRVSTRIAEIGAVVKAGQTLATVDDTDVRNELRAAEAQLISASSLAAQASAAFERAKGLIADEAGSVAELERAEAEDRAARAQRSAALAAVDQAKRRVAYAVLRAEEDGVVTAVGANSGQVVAPGQMVVTVASLHQRDAIFHIPETVSHVDPDDLEVEIVLVSDPSVRTTGVVREVSPAADALTRTFRVKVALPSPPESMALGASVTGRALLPADRLFELPAAAMTSQQGDPAVFVVADGPALERRPVQVARYHESTALIHTGLLDGDVVVTAGVSKLRPGQAVRLEEVAR